MFGGMFGGTFFGGIYDIDTAPPTTNTNVTDSAWVSDWDTVTDGLGTGDETAVAVESVATTGLGFGNKAVDDEANAVDSAVAVGLDTGGGTTTPGDCDVRFVDGISLSAATRFDFFGPSWTVLFEGSDTTPPEMADQRASSMLVDGELVTASVWRNRIVTLVLLLKASTPQQAAVELRDLARELNRTTNVLWWQPNTALPPTFFRTYRSPDYQIEADWGINLHRVTLRLEAEPLARDLAENLTATINFDPAAATNPCYVDLPAVKGDVPSPLYITSASTSLSGRKVALATRRRGDPDAFTWYRQADALTLGADTTVTGPDSSASGGSAARVSFATDTSSVARVSGTFPIDGGSVDWRGTYRMFARVRLNGSTTVIKVAGGTTMSRNQAVTLTAASASNYVLLDLDRVRIPYGNAGRAAGFGPESAAAAATLLVYAERVSGIGTCDIDYVFLVPADMDYVLAQCPTVSGGSQVVFDGPNAAVYGRNSAGDLTASTGIVAHYGGTLPQVDPAQANRLFLLPGVESNTSTPQTGTAVLNLTYWPARLLVGSDD